MASIIPNRPPQTPLLQYFSEGRYPKDIERKTFNRQGEAAPIYERNNRISKDVNIKPITERQVDLKQYNPKQHLQQLYVHTGMQKNMSINSLHSYKLLQHKQNAEDQKSRFLSSAGKEVSKKDFNRLKQCASERTLSRPMTEQRSVALPEFQNYITQNENKYYGSNKTFFKGDNDKKGNYHYSTPEYLRPLEDQRNTIDFKKMKAQTPGQSITVISKSNGWLTVDPVTQNRNEAYEKKMRGNVHKVSQMSPSWMQTMHQPDKQAQREFKGKTLFNQNTRAEKNRVLLSDAQPPPKSIFNVGTLRHNMMSKEQAQQVMKQKNVTSEPVRLIEWRETPFLQRFDKKVATKIGQDY